METFRKVRCSAESAAMTLETDYSGVLAGPARLHASPIISMERTGQPAGSSLKREFDSQITEPSAESQLRGKRSSEEAVRFLHLLSHCLGRRMGGWSRCIHGVFWSPLRVLLADRKNA